MTQMHVQFIKRQVRLLRCMASDDAFPSRAQLRDILADLGKSGKVGQLAKETLRKWREDILTSEPGEHSIFADFIPTFDQFAQKLLAGGVAISWEDDYVNGLYEYRANVIEHLRSVWRSKGNKQKAPEKLPYFEGVLTRMAVWMTPVIDDEHLPVPFLCGSVLDYAWSSMSAVTEGLKEVSYVKSCAKCQWMYALQVSRWFEPLIDWHKLLWQQSHSMDDATETIFRALERDSRYDSVQAVNMVSVSYLHKVHHTT